MNIDLTRLFIPWTVLSAMPLFVAFAHLLKRLGLSGDMLIAGALPLAVVGGVLVACLRLYALERARLRLLHAAAKPAREEGYTAIGGRLRAGEAALVSPLDGQPCGLLAWEIDQPRRKNAPLVIGHGGAVAEAMLDTPDGPLRLQGEPQLSELCWSTPESPEVILRLAHRLLDLGLEQRPTAARMEGLLAPRDLQREQAAEAVAADRLDAMRWGDLHRGLLPVVPWSSIAATAAVDRDAAARHLAESLMAAGCRCHLASLPVGAEVTAVGRWDAAPQRLIIAGGGRWHGLLGLGFPQLCARSERRTRRCLVAIAVLGLLIVAGVMLAGRLLAAS